MGENHTDGALGLAPLDPRHQQPGNAQPAHRGSIIEAQGRRTKAMLFQSEPMHRTGGLEKWRAHRSNANNQVNSPLYFLREKRRR